MVEQQSQTKVEDDIGARALGAPASQNLRRLLPLVVPLLIFTAVAGLFAVALKKGDPSRIPSALIGKPAPRMDLPAVDGVSVPGLGASAFGQGKPLVVNFWASWCVQCIEEHPQLVELVKRSGVALVGVNHKDQPANASRFLAQHGNPYTAIGADPSGRAAIEWGVYGMPETFIVDGNGTVVFKHVGPITPKVLGQVVLPALERAKGPAS